MNRLLLEPPVVHARDHIGRDHRWSAVRWVV